MSAVEESQVKEAQVREAAEKLPPLSDEQVARVAALLSLPTLGRPVVGSRGGRS